MLISDYLVGRNKDGVPITLVVKDVLPVDCQPGRSDLVNKIIRQDLVQEFVQDGVEVEWVIFPDLPDDVVALLKSGQGITIIDKVDDTVVNCSLSKERESMSKIAR